MSDEPTKRAGILPENRKLGMCLLAIIAALCVVVVAIAMVMGKEPPAEAIWTLAGACVGGIVATLTGGD